MRDFPRPTRITPIIVAACLVCGLAQSALASYAAAERARWRKVIQDAQIQPE